MEEEQQLFIPKKIKVGYQKRDDTYTNRLAYVIYFDNKGVLRKETSWQGWRDKTIEPHEFENVPTEGFVLNKGVGGQRHSYGWDARNEYIRVYDPRNFEFEISVANLLYILQECTSTKGKGLEGEFVYSWEGKELVLLPVGSGAYKNSTNFTNLQDGKVSAKELIIGATYMDKRQNEIIYLGKFPYYKYNNSAYSNERMIISEKMHTFINKSGDYVYNKNVAFLSKCIDSTPASDYAELMDAFNRLGNNVSKPVCFIAKSKEITINIKSKSPWDKIKPSDSNVYYKLSDDEFVQCKLEVAYHYDFINRNYIYEGIKLCKQYITYFFKDGVLHTKPTPDSFRHDNNYKIYDADEINTLPLYDLYLKFENGREISINNHYFNY